jgi:hypothetical protein
MGSSDCHETETRVHGRAVPAIATAPAEIGKNRGTGRELTVMITKRKMDPYPEALVQERSAIFLQGASLLSVVATACSSKIRS